MVAIARFAGPRLPGRFGQAKETHKTDTEANHKQAVMADSVDRLFVRGAWRDSVWNCA
jgi:hypothetical protein